MKKVPLTRATSVPLNDGYSPIQQVSTEGYKPNAQKKGSLKHNAPPALGGYQPIQTSDNPANKVKPPVKK